MENLLIGEAAVAELLRDANPDDDIDDIRLKLRFQEFLEDCGKLFDLFSLYAVVFMLGIPVKTVSYSIHKLCKRASERYRISEALVVKRSEEVNGEIYNLATADQVDNARRVVASLIHARKLSVLRHISGKHYLFPLLHTRSRVLAKYQEAEHVMKARLARYYDIATEPGLKRAIDRLLST